MDWLQTILLALIQGLTEFLPISSSAHLILPAQLLGWTDQGLAFDMVVHLGTLMAVMSYFRRQLLDMYQGTVSGISQQRMNQDLRLMLLVGLATIPVVVAGLFGRHWIEGVFREETVIIATTTVLFAILLGGSEYLGSHRRGLAQVGVTVALVIGLFQVLALIPGTSRSGITMTAALLFGLTRTDAARFSFLMSIPVIAGACLLMLIELVGSGNDVAWAHLLTAFAVSGLVAYFTIHWFLKLLDRVGMMPFVMYRLLLGAVLFLFFV